MALADAVQGAIRPAQQITWSREDGTAEDLSGATLTGFIRSQRTGTTRAIAGTLALTTAASGIFTWTYAAADVVDAGNFDVQFVATFGSDPTPAKTFTTKWVVSLGLSVA
jgi:hypothetical protein